MNNKIIPLIIAAALIIGAGVAAYGWNQVRVDKEGTVEHVAEAGPSGAVSVPSASSQVRENADNGVTVIVTPPDFSNTTTPWNFDVVMSTHVQELGGYDLVKMATLVDDAGKTYTPISWQPDAKEGHHIGGSLQFDRVALNSKSITLKIGGVGGTEERIFQWSIK
jgi:hypothetical protein